MPPSSRNFAADFYERLGLTPRDDAAGIRRQFRLLARLYHPDVNPSAEAQRHFMGMQEAYHVLSDKAQRQEYLLWLEQAPAARRPFTLALHLYPTALRRAVGSQRVYALLELRAQQDGPLRRVPLNMVLAVDRSASMKGKRLHYVKEAAQRIVKRLTPEDFFGIVAFNDRGGVVLPNGPATNIPVALGAIESIQATGGTELASGLRLAIQETLKFHSPNVLSHVLLLTDGRTYGDEALALDLADRATGEEIGLTALGLGTDWNDEFLDDLAQRMGGSAHFIAAPEQAEEVFGTRLQHLQQTYARNVRLQLALGPESRLLAAHEVAPSLRTLPARDNELALGAVAATPPLGVLLELEVKPPPRDVALIGNFSLLAHRVADGQQHGAEQLAVCAVGDEEAESPPAALYQAARRVATLRMQHRTWAALEAGEEEASRALGDLADRFLELGAGDLALATQREAETVQRTGKLSEDGRMAIKYGTRHLALSGPEAEG